MGDDSLPLWGGIECTVNRVEHRYFDQLEISGHAARASDLELISSIGIQKLRYPVLWERCHRSLDELDFTWADERLSALRALDIQPIVGLLHHGSGPTHTSLLDPRFPELLASYAAKLARRFPWVDHYTPVNEPLTTARFSCLYGHWYPHARDDRSFVRALLNQCRGVAIAMRAIRSVNPAAQLIQTDDMGFTRSTAALAYQADFENERRWLSFDLLCGKVDRSHPLFGYLRRAGATELELARFRDNPCPPDVVGLNYYVTSERFLDHRVERYPERHHGGNHRDTYADVEAVRVCADGLLGAAPLLRRAHERYGLPVAITEAHLGCSVDQQIAWFSYVARGAEEARRSGVDVRAVTAWALLGAHDWHCLVTRREGVYESGAFCLRTGAPRETELSRFLRQFASHGTLSEIEGWWARPDRLLYEPYVASAASAFVRAPATTRSEASASA